MHHLLEVLTQAEVVGRRVLHHPMAVLTQAEVAGRRVVHHLGGTCMGTEPQAQ